MGYSFYRAGGPNFADFNFIGGVIGEELNAFDRTLYNEKIETTILLNNEEVTKWFYNDCLYDNCVTQLRLRVVITFFEESWFGNWNQIDQQSYIIGNGDAPGDLYYIGLVPTL